MPESWTLLDILQTVAYIGGAAVWLFGIDRSRVTRLRDLEEARTILTLRVDEEVERCDLLTKENVEMKTRLALCEAAHKNLHEKVDHNRYNCRTGSEGIVDLLNEQEKKIAEIVQRLPRRH